MDYKTKICYWNANGLKTKTTSLNYFIKHNNIDLMFISETKFSEKDKFKIRGYSIIRQDGPTNRSGGLIAIIKNGVPYRTLPKINNTIEHIIIKLSNNMLLVPIYNRPSNKFSSQDIEAFLALENQVILIGDFNARSLIWNCHNENRNGKTIRGLIENNDIHVLFPNKPTHYPNNNSTPTTIDIIVNKNTPQISQPISEVALDSDHNPITCTIDYNTNIQLTKIRSFAQTNWKNFRNNINEKLSLETQIDSTEKLDQTIEKFTTLVESIMKKHSKTTPINPYRENLPQNILDLIAKKNRFRKIYQQTLKQNYKAQINQLTTTIRNQIKEFRDNKWRQQLGELKPGDSNLWTITKRLKKPIIEISLLEQNNEHAITESDKVEMLAETFRLVHEIKADITTEQKKITSKVDEFLSHPTIIDPQKVARFFISPNKLKQHIKKLPNRKAPGHDNIPNLILKNLPNKALVQIVYLINSIIKLQYFPSQWKKAIIVPIPKPNKPKNEPSSYRPISLLTTLSKITEYHIKSHLDQHLKKHKIIIDEQFGFTEKRNALQQTARVANDIITGFNKKHVTAMLLLDLKTAFDTVWKEGLIYKLISIKLDPVLTRIINSYLSSRTFTVKINNTYSSTKTVNSGTPQGSILGPKLFNIYINDIPKSHNTQLALYADDTLIYTHSDEATIANLKLKRHYEIIKKYFDHWKLTLNTSKSENIIIARTFRNREVPYPLKLDNITIQPSDTAVKYLGVHFDKRLNFIIHLHARLKQSYKAAAMLYPLMKKHSGLSLETKRTLYKTCIRPTLLYAIPVWCGISKLQKAKLQVYQNKCLRLITERDRYTNIDDLHETAKVETIDNYIRKTSEKFYRTQLQHNKLLRDITRIRKTSEIKHKPLHYNLPIFEDSATSSDNTDEESDSESDRAESNSDSEVYFSAKSTQNDTDYDTYGSSELSE